MEKSFFRKVLEGADDALRAGIVMSPVIQYAGQEIHAVLDAMFVSEAVLGNALSLQGVHWGDADEDFKSNPRECIFVSVNVIRETADDVRSENDLFAIPLAVVNAEQHIRAAHEFVRDQNESRLKQNKAAESTSTAVFSFDLVQEAFAPYFESVKELR